MRHAHGVREARRGIVAAPHGLLQLVKPLHLQGHTDSVLRAAVDHAALEHALHDLNKLGVNLDRLRGVARSDVGVDHFGHDRLRVLTARCRVKQRARAECVLHGVIHLTEVIEHLGGHERCQLALLEFIILVERLTAPHPTRQQSQSAHEGSTSSDAPRDPYSSSSQRAGAPRMATPWTAMVPSGKVSSSHRRNEGAAHREHHWHRPPPPFPPTHPHALPPSPPTGHLL